MESRSPTPFSVDTTGWNDLPSRWLRRAGAGSGVIAMTSFTKGDKVAWNSSQGEVKGKVVRKATTPTRIKGHKVAASEDNPEYIVESARTGALAAHKPESLRKL
jgi:hypothetical protein